MALRQYTKYIVEDSPHKEEKHHVFPMSPHLARNAIVRLIEEGICHVTKKVIHFKKEAAKFAAFSN